MPRHVVQRTFPRGRHLAGARCRPGWFPLRLVEYRVSQEDD